jgi:hypothetical protein
MEFTINDCRYKGCNFFIQIFLFQIKEVYNQGVVADMISCKGNRQAHVIPMRGIVWDAMNYYDIDMSVISALIGECTVTITKKNKCTISGGCCYY